LRARSRAEPCSSASTALFARARSRAAPCSSASTAHVAGCRARSCATGFVSIGSA
jgi:hypothetical protein